MNAKYRLFALLLAITLPLDRLSKLWIIDRFHYGERFAVIDGFFDLTHVRNPGGAFSLFANGPFEQRMLFFVGTTCLAVVLLVVFLVRLEAQARLAAVALGAILGGALGNLTDRLVYGEVIDFIDIHLMGGYTWPTFNLADSFIVCGVAILIAETFTEPHQTDAEPPVGQSAVSSR